MYSVKDCSCCDAFIVLSGSLRFVPTQRKIWIYYSLLINIICIFHFGRYLIVISTTKHNSVILALQERCFWPLLNYDMNNAVSRPYFSSVSAKVTALNYHLISQRPSWDGVCSDISRPFLTLSFEIVFLTENRHMVSFC